MTLATHPFVFPLGHKVRVAAFVSEVSSAMKRKGKVSSQPRPSKKSRVAQEEVVADNEELNLLVSLLPAS